MAIQPVYLVAAKNLGSFLKALGHAQAPEKMNLKFIEDLGFKSTNDRLFIPLLKAMHFLDDTGKPTARYHQFLDDTQSARVLADGIRDAFSDLFRIVKNAHTLSREQLVGKLKSLGEGKLSTSKQPARSLRQKRRWNQPRRNRVPPTTPNQPQRRLRPRIRPLADQHRYHRWSTESR